jgi:dissimilatory sulfite reductase (desulfoviridin) alpha/beta subunit
MMLYFLLFYSLYGRIHEVSNHLPPVNHCIDQVDPVDVWKYPKKKVCVWVGGRGGDFIMSIEFFSKNIKNNINLP